MKKLMILGGSRYVLPVIKAAHELGVYVITCDYLPDNIAHRYSDEYCNVSIIEKEAVLEKAVELKIDGITSFACDPGVVTAAYVAEKMGLPSVGSYESVSILQNKGKFRRFLAENGFNVPKARSYSDAETAMKDIDYFNWPIIAKPVDSAGSKGVIKVTDTNRLSEAIHIAIDNSFNGEFIIEDYLESVGAPSDSDAFSVDGDLKFVSFNAQLFDDEASNPHTPAGFYWEPTISADHQEELKTELQRLISLLNLKDSLYNIETRECVDGKAYIMECSPRGGGNRLSECLEMATGVKLIENAVRASLGMETVGLEQKPYDGLWAEAILHSDKEGLFEGIEISPLLDPYIVEKDLWIKPEQRIREFTGANETIGTLILKFPDSNQMESIMKKIKEHIHIKVKEPVGNLVRGGV